MTDSLPLILFIRHGETEWNLAARYQGHTDIPLNQRGRTQAARNGEALGDLLGERGLAVADMDFVASPLSRASETMRIVRRALGIPEDDFRRDDRLMEARYGAWEGLTLPEITARDRAGLERRRLDPIDFAPEGGESYRAVGDRALAALGELTRPSVVVAHGGVSKAVRGRILKLSPADTMALPVPQDRIFVIENGQVGTY